MRPDNAKTSVRQAAVAGLFYPKNPRQLRAVVSEYLRQPSFDADAPPPKALIVPHAGYVYSGRVAGVAYARLAARTEIRRIVLIGPSHRVYLHGMAVPSCEAFETPLGTIPIDRELTALLSRRPDVVKSDGPHALEHCVEVQLPFLQTLFPHFTLLPIVLGAATPEQVASALALVWGGNETSVLVSSDLSHYQTYQAAQRIDAATSAAILRHETTISDDQACGAVAINGLLHLARERRLPVTEIGRCNSGDTAGDKSRVVGYGAFAVHEAGFDTAA